MILHDDHLFNYVARYQLAINFTCPAGGSFIFFGQAITSYNYSIGTSLTKSRKITLPAGLSGHTRTHIMHGWVGLVHY